MSEEALYPAWVGGTLFAPGQARIALDDPGAARGLAALETIALRGGHACFLDRHLARLAHTARALGFAAPSTEVLEAALSEYVEALRGSGRTGALLRLTLARSGSGGAPRIALGARALPDPPPAATVALTREPIHLGAAARLKTTSRLAYELAREEARARGGHEAILVGFAGELLEGSASNLFAVLEGELWTAPVSAGVLPGVLRGLVLEEVAALDGVVRETALPRALLGRCEELLLTSAAVRVLPVQHVLGEETRLAGSSGAWARLLAERIRSREERDRMRCDR